jgi:hypothetical protein
MTPISRPAGQNAPNEGVDGTDTGRTVGGGSLNGPNQRLSQYPDGRPRTVDRSYMYITSMHVPVRDPCLNNSLNHS